MLALINKYEVNARKYIYKKMLKKLKKCVISVFIKLNLNLYKKFTSIPI